MTSRRLDGVRFGRQRTGSALANRAGNLLRKAGRGRRVRRPARLTHLGTLFVTSLLALTAPLAAQDTVQVISPERTTRDSATVLPAAVIAEAMAAYNDSGAIRLVGPFYLPKGARLTGSVALFGGSIRVAGEVVGRVTVVNGLLIIDEGGRVEGSVLVTGGQILTRPGGRIEGPSPREYRAAAPLIRTSAGLLAPRPPPRSLTELASARRSFTTGHFRTTLSAETGRTYNRVEGLPIVLGPSITREGLRDLDGRLDLRGIVWTTPDRTSRRADFGYTARAEFRFGQTRQLTVGLLGSRLVVPIQPQPLAGYEAGWAAFLLQRDYRDYYQAQGFGGYASYRFGGGTDPTGEIGGTEARSPFTLFASLRRDYEQSVPAGDPVSVFRNEAWRPNPLVDDGHYLTVRLGFDLDTRNDREAPASGWLVHGFWERTRSGDAAPLTLPPEVRAPITPGTYSSVRLWLDARRYDRLSPSVRAGARLLAAGWIAGDPLPVQRRLSLGGPDLLPGYPFRSQNCAPAELSDPATPAWCDRMLAAQLEIRTRARIGLPIATGNNYLVGMQRILGIRDPDVVLFGDAGKAWVTGEGPGRVPNNRIPLLREWDYDFGLGLDFGGLAVYLAQPLNKSSALTFTARLTQRF